ncbi:MAG: hypothetical protein LBL19_06180 [Spirochaetaceae bacterium]|nr:hypothetical protein [Spirochaetaceae bacterium]
MKRYYVKTSISRLEYFDILEETEDEYRIRLTKIYDGNEKILENSISRRLFDMCLKTGYIYEIKEVVLSVA